MLRTSFVCGLLGTAALVACKPRVDGTASKVLTNASNPNEMAVDVNDLSYLLPRNAAGQIYPEIRVASTWSDLRAQNRLRPFDEGGTTAILTKPVYDSLVAATADQQNFGQKPNSIKTPFTAKDVSDFEHDSFVITSFRIDPCAPSLALDKARTNYQNPLSQTVAAGITAQINQEIADIFGANKFTLAACQTQLRLILQPVSADRKTIKESTIHMVFTLNGGAGVMNDTLQADVQGLKKKLQDVTGVDTTGYLLQPHPGLQAEAAANQDSLQSGPGAQALVDYLSTVLHKFNSPQVMAAIREKVVGGVQYDVVLGGGVSDPRVEATYTAGPLVGSSAKKGFIITSNANRRTWRMDPQPTRNNPVFDNLITFDGGRIDTPQDSALVNMMKKDDPESTHFFVNDCVTCHGTSQAFREIADLNIAATAATRYKVPVGVSGFPIGTFLPPAPQGTGDQVIGVALRNFGYSHGKPIIGLRTVTETAALVDYFNRDLRRIANPGAACDDKAETRAWVAAISMGLPQSSPDYVFAKGTASREDQLFDGVGCAKQAPARGSADGNAALGTRGDGANTPKLGNQQSPIFSQMSYEGTGASPAGNGPMTLTLAKMGQAVVSQSQGTNAPELTLGTWTYVADPVSRVSQIQVTLDGQNILLAMNGAFLCELTSGNAKARLVGCLALQAGWNKGAKAPPAQVQIQAPVATNPTKPVAKPIQVPSAPAEIHVGLFESDDCSGSPVTLVVASTDCSKIARTTVRAVQIAGQGCMTFANPVYDDAAGSRLACTRVKAVTTGKYAQLFYSDECDNRLFVAAVGTPTDCPGLDSQTLNSVWGRKIGAGKCQDTKDVDFADGCNEAKAGL